ncbi:Transmembrane -like protein [Trichinella pseudospiralis]|uniref:Transmembrane-like protein n=1 Tax=Trichinella pseudospiralis TaxID=6337 RepID=A0A0V0YHK1_TRIPS|nr:Transmembrane -like protein [Trichinella pseudospiralis]KRX99831.1 Transmembrane -like protein [Trichinella pseudospiralis]
MGRIPSPENRFVGDTEEALKCSSEFETFRRTIPIFVVGFLFVVLFVVDLTFDSCIIGSILVKYVAARRLISLVEVTFVVLYCLNCCITAFGYSRLWMRMRQVTMTPEQLKLCGIEEDSFVGSCFSQKNKEQSISSQLDSSLSASLASTFTGMSSSFAADSTFNSSCGCESGIVGCERCSSLVRSRRTSPRHMETSRDECATISAYSFISPLTLTGKRGQQPRFRPPTTADQYKKILAEAQNKNLPPAMFSFPADDHRNRYLPTEPDHQQLANDAAIADNKKMRSATTRGKGVGGGRGGGCGRGGCGAGSGRSVGARSGVVGALERRWEVVGRRLPLQRFHFNDDRLLLSAENFKLWMLMTIIRPLVEEIESTNERLASVSPSDVALALGDSPPTVLQTVVTSRVGERFGSLAVLLNYLEATSGKTVANHKYVIVRLKQLAADVAIGEYKWNGGSSFEGKPWDSSTLPTDTEILCSMLCTFLDSLMPINPLSLEAKTFTDAHMVRGERKRARPGVDPLHIRQTGFSPPHYKLVDHGQVYDVGPGKYNFFFTLVLFFQTLKLKRNSLLGPISLGPGGLNLAWTLVDCDSIIDED